MSDLTDKALERGMTLEELVTKLSERNGFDPEKLLSSGKPLDVIADGLYERIQTTNDVSTYDAGFWETALFKAQEANTLTENVGTLLGSVVPISIPVWEDGGLRWASREEVWGKEYLNATPDVRRQHLLNLKEQSLEQSNPELYESDRAGEQGEFGGAGGVLGTIAGTLADPTTLLAPQATLAKTALADAVLGGAWSVANQSAQTGKVSASQTAMDTAIAGVAGPLLVNVPAGAKFAGEKIRKLTRKMKGKELTGFDIKASQVQDAFIEEIASGVELEPALARARERVGLTGDEYYDVMTKSSGKFYIPETLEEARDIVKAREAQNMPTAQRVGLLGKFGEAAGDIWNTFDTEIGRISSTAKTAIAKYDLGLSVRIQEANQAIEPFVRVFNSLGDSGVVSRLKGERNDVQRRVALALANGEFGAVKDILAREAGDEGIQAFEQVRALMKKMHSEGKAEGLLDKEVENYFPRIVKNLASLERRLTGAQQSRYQRALQRKAEDLEWPGDRSTLPVEVKNEVMNSVMRGRRDYIAEGRANSSKPRQIDEVTLDMLDDYEDPITALNKYIRNSTSKLEKRKLFGLGKATKKETARASSKIKRQPTETIMDETDVSADGLTQTIGNYVNRIAEEDGLSADEMGRIEDLIRARFDSGEQSMGPKMSFARNIAHTILLGNFMSAMVQLGDIGISAYRNGFTNTIKALFTKAGNKVSVEDLGLDNVIGEAVDSFTGTAKLLNGALHYSGFKAVDRLGKNTFLRSSLLKKSNMAKNAKGREVLAKELRETFGDETESVIQDLVNGDVTDNVKLMLWNDITSYQPISLSQMPVEYLKNPNLRMFYLMKTFGLKQLDLLRNDVVSAAQKGDKAKAAKALAQYMMIVPTANLTVQEARNFLLDRDSLDADSLPDAFAEAMLRTFFINEYMINRWGKDGDVPSMIASTVAPPIQFYSDISTALFGVGKSIIAGDIDEIPPDVLKHTPIFGSFINNFLLGGREKFNERRED